MTTDSDDIFMAKYDASGKITGTAIIDEIPLEATAIGNEDVFLAKFNSSGNRIWVQRAGGSGIEFGRRVVLDAAGNSFIAGQYGSTLASFGCSSISNKGLGDIYVANYSPSGTILWAASAGGSEDEYANRLSIDGADNCYVAGHFNTSASFGATTLTSSGDNDIFVARLFSIPASISRL